jgi:hypothetical protein
LITGANHGIGPEPPRESIGMPGDTQNGSTSGTSILQTGSSFRSRAATLSQACKSVYAFGSVKIVTGLISESDISVSQPFLVEISILEFTNRSY